MNRTVITLAAACVLLTLAYLGILWQKRRQHHQLHLRSLPLLGDIQRETVSGIELELIGEAVRLKKKGNTWVLSDYGNFPANPTYVNMLLDTLSTTPQGDIITDDVSQHAQFDLAGRARVIKLFDAQEREIHRLYVGKHHKTYRATYVRLRDDPVVRFVTADLIPVISRPTWADRWLWRVPASAITRIHAEPWFHGFQLEQTGPALWQWVDPQGQITPLSAPDALIQPLAQFQASFVKFNCFPDASNKQAEITLDASGVRMVLNLFQDDTGNWLGTRDHPGACYVIAESTVACLQQLGATTGASP